MTVVIVVVAKARRIFKRKEKKVFFSGSSISSVLAAGSGISRTLIATGTVCLLHALVNLSVLYRGLK